jgi:2,3,4,5-tetrahydropyridine-2,6-dicarboxylate N-succinyltransferase
MKDIIEKAWEVRSSQDAITDEMRASVLSTLDALDSGKLRVCEKVGDKWVTHEWLKKAILLSFSLRTNGYIPQFMAYDKVPLKFEGWSDKEFSSAGFRVIPGAVVRHSAYIADKVVLMPSFVNVGAYVGTGTMIDTWATVGSCAQVGSHCHISGGVGIGGVLEPLQANPVIIEDNVFIGARSEVAEGVIIGEGSVLSMGVYLGASTRVYNRETGETVFGYVPPYSVVVPGTMPSSDGKTQTYAAIIVKTVDEKTKSKTSINDLLRG